MAQQQGRVKMVVMVAAYGECCRVAQQDADRRTNEREIGSRRRDERENSHNGLKYAFFCTRERGCAKYGHGRRKKTKRRAVAQWSQSVASALWSQATAGAAG